MRVAPRHIVWRVATGAASPLRAQRVSKGIQAIEVEARDAVADSVKVGERNRASIVIGAGAASRLLVEVAD